MVWQKGKNVRVDHLSMTIEKGETYGLVGESGCGKSTTGRAIVGLSPADSGSILYEGKDLCKMKNGRCAHSGVSYRWCSRILSPH